MIKKEERELRREERMREMRMRIFRRRRT